MNELITITTGGQGLPVVSARELHAFLEVRSKFASWITNRIKDFGFIENEDYTTFSKNLENGGRSTEYALTLNMAKELSMVERNPKGREARQYFIQCEETLRSNPGQASLFLPTDQVLLQLIANQQTQLIASLQTQNDQQTQIDQLRAEVNHIQQARHRPPKSRLSQQLTVPGLPERRRPTLSLRSQINQRVDTYCNQYGHDRRETWNYLYKRLYNLYGISAHQLIRKPKENVLDALERYGHLEVLFKIVREELPTHEV